MDTETPTKKLAVGDTISTAAEYASLPVGSIVRGWAVAERCKGVDEYWRWIDSAVEEIDGDAGAAAQLGEVTILWIEPEPEPEPRWLSRDPQHVREDFREGLEAALIAVHGDAVTNDQWVMAAMIIGLVEGFNDIETVFVATLSEFGVAVWSALLLNSIEAKNTLMNQATVMSHPRDLARRGLTVADLGWPNEVLHPRYQTR
ncbi:hypothetical protein ACFVU2_19295 [Leifsonia sp. NPDC058194]|uniref:hypothetical protein n=1 Tax=Leifsonia sp. NPDC058194 TaxID=3346374 RepID=UPI0036D78469